VSLLANPARRIFHEGQPPSPANWNGARGSTGSSFILLVPKLRLGTVGLGNSVSNGDNVPIRNGSFEELRPQTKFGDEEKLSIPLASAFLKTEDEARPGGQQTIASTNLRQD
jgi:hypothetical protein